MSTEQCELGLYDFYPINLFSVVPHITDAIQEWVMKQARVTVDEDGVEPQVCVIEVSCLCSRQAGMYIDGQIGFSRSVQKDTENLLFQVKSVTYFNNSHGPLSNDLWPGHLFSALKRSRGGFGSEIELSMLPEAVDPVIQRAVGEIVELTHMDLSVKQKNIILKNWENQGIKKWMCL